MLFRSRALRSIGIDHVLGYFDVQTVRDANLTTQTYPTVKPVDLQGKIEQGKVRLVDVRAKTEFDEGHIAQAEHHFLGRLLRELQSLPKSKPIVAQCLGGGRAAIATSILQRAGYDVTNMQGGFKAWVAANLPVESKELADIAMHV